jgi:hypothetical protein
MWALALNVITPLLWRWLHRADDSTKTAPLAR